MRKVLISVIACFALVGTVGACSSSSNEDTATSAATTSTDLCATPQTFTDKELEPVLKAVQLPAGTRLINEQNVSNTDNRSQIDLIVRICAPGVTGDALKDTATLLARSVKGSPSESRVASMRVTNLAEESTPGGKVRCEDFQLRTFGADADQGAVRTSWETS